MLKWSLLSSPRKKRQLGDTIDGDDGCLALPAPDCAMALEDAVTDFSTSSSLQSASLGYEGTGFADVGPVEGLAGDDGDIDGDDVADELPKYVCGQLLKRELHKDTGHMGLRVQWRKHHNCRKFRAVTKQAEVFGPKAPYYVLGAWLQSDHKPVDKHRSYSPSRADVCKFILEDEG